mgnify:FL=1
MLLAALQSQMQILKQARLSKYSLAGLKMHFSTSQASTNFIADRIAKVTDQKPEKRWLYLQSIDLDLYNSFSSLTPSQSFQILQSFANYSNYHLLRSYSIQSLLSIIIRNTQSDFDVQSVVLDLALILKKLKYQYIEEYDDLNKLLLSKKFEEFSIEELQKIVDFWEYYSWRHPISSEIASFISKAAEAHRAYLSGKKNLTAADMATEVKLLNLKALINPKKASEIDVNGQFKENLSKYLETNNKVAATLEILGWIPELESLELKNFQELIEKLYQTVQGSFVKLVNEKEVHSNREEKRDLEVLADELFSRKKVDGVFAALVADQNELCTEGLLLILSKMQKYGLQPVLHSHDGVVEKLQSLRSAIEKGEKSVSKADKERLTTLFADLDIYVS